MSDAELCFLAIEELSQRIRERVVSPVEVTDAFLDRIEARDAALNSYITVAAARARAEAAKAEAEVVSGTLRGPLHGIPLAYKDIVDVAGLPTTCGSRVLADNQPAGNASVIDLLEDAGAITLGKLNMNEFATLLASEHFGPVANPWSAAHSPGGSSSGSGAAVAAGLCAGALGTDTGGSIRIPAAFGGIVGLKPTHGRVSLHGVTPLAWSLDHIGPMTRTVTDAALLMNAIAGYDAQDLCSRAAPVPDFTAELDRGVRGRRLAVADGFFPALTDPESGRAFESALEVLRGLGAAIEVISLPDLTRAWDCADTIIGAEASTWHAPLLDTAGEAYGVKVRRFLERARPTPASAYIEALRVKAALRREMLQALAPFDALLTPGSLVPPPPLDARTLDLHGQEVSLRAAIVSATAPFNLTGQPALSVPCGFTAAGLPLSLQIVGRPFEEPTILGIGAAYEGTTEWHQHRPDPG